MIANLIFSCGVMLVGLQEVSYYPTPRIQRQFGRPQTSIDSDHVGYTCPLRACIIERIEEAWINRALIWSIIAP